MTSVENNKVNFPISDLISMIQQMLGVLDKVQDKEVHEKWLVIYEIHQIIYSLIITNTCLDLFAFNKISKYYNTGSFYADDWLVLLDGYLKAFLKNCKEES